MRAWYVLRQAIRTVISRRAKERELDDELQSYVEEHTRRNLAAGMSYPDARAAALRLTGSAQAVKDYCRDTWRPAALLDDCRRDLQYAWRTFTRAPSFALLAVLTLGVGIGINTIVFTVTNAVLFKGFPLVAENDELLYVTSGRGCCVSYPDFQDWRTQARSFADMALVHGIPATVNSGTGHPLVVAATEITPNTFGLVGQQPILGRDFADHDAEPGAPTVAIIRYGAWQRWFGGDPAVVGRQLRVNGQSATIIGVMPRGFSFPQNQDVWVPLRATAESLRRDARENWFALARLSEGVTVERARSEMSTIGARLAAAYPDTNQGRNSVPIVSTFEDFFVGTSAGAVYRAMWGAVAFVLLIACANLANLLLARGLARAREFSVRVAIGASRWRVVRQMLAESLLLSAGGGLIGWWIAKAGVAVYAVTANGPGISEEISGTWFVDVLDYSMDSRAVLYLAGVSLVTVVVFGLLPALRLSKLNVQAGLKPGARGVSAEPGSRRLSRMLVAAEMTLAVVLLAGAGTLARGFLTIYLADPGIDTDSVTVAQVSLPRSRYPDVLSQQLFVERLFGKLGEQAATERVAGASALPGWNLTPRPFDIDGVTVHDNARPVTGAVTIAGDYFTTLGLRVTAGRDFERSDDGHAPLVAIVNERFAARYVAGDPLGRRIRVVARGNPGSWMTIVGIAPDIVQHRDLQHREPVIYVSAQQHPLTDLWVLVKSRAAGERLEAPLRSALASLDPELPLADGPAPLADRLARNYQYRRVVATLFALFAGIAVLLAALGLYGVMAHAVAERTREIGIRTALGGSARQVLGLVARDALRPIVAGLVGGIIAAVALEQLLRAELAQVRPSDPVMLGAATAVLIFAAVLGCLIPARRALRVDAAIALRGDC